MPPLSQTRATNSGTGQLDRLTGPRQSAHVNSTHDTAAHTQLLTLGLKLGYNSQLYARPIEYCYPLSHQVAYHN